MSTDERVTAGKTERREIPPTPAVFMFQPTHYVTVPPEKLALWESDLKANVGQRIRPDARIAGTETWSISFGEWGWDDCDEI